MDNVRATIKVLEAFGGGRAMHYKEIYELAVENGWMDATGVTPWHTMNRDVRLSIYGNKDSFISMPKKYSGMFVLSNEVEEVIVPEVVYTNKKTTGGDSYGRQTLQ